MLKYKVIKNAVETNSWLSSYADETHYEACFGLPERLSDPDDPESEVLPAEYTIEIEDLGNSLDWASLRSERNTKLSACDWTQLSDSPMSSENKAAWATHRQALRDLPENTEDPTNPTWPEEP